MHYYKRHLGDYAKDTRHLTMLQHGAFTLLLDWYYSSERPLPLDRCDRIANAGTPAEREAVQFVLRDFFVETPEGWISRRADKEIAAMQEKSGKAANSAKARWDNNQGMRTHSERIANAVPTQCEGNASHKPLSTTNKEPDQKKKQPPQAVSSFVPPDWIDPVAWSGYLAMRKKKRAPPTDRACQLVVSELAKLKAEGQNPTAVLEQSTRNSWTDVYALKTNGANHHERKQPAESLADAAVRRLQTIPGFRPEDQ